MINFIIYEDDESLRSTYKNIIRNFMRNLNYDIYDFSKFNKEVYDKIKNIMGKKIFLLDAEVTGVSGLEIAKNIRNSGDWDSQIIVITECERYLELSFTTRLLRFDFISKFSDIKRELYFSLNTAYNILNNRDTLVFKCGGEIFQLLYNDIYYIEKNLCDNDSTIFTRGDSYVIKSSINKIMEKIGDDPRFFKCHRSCIVNLNNICSFDMNNNVIRFRDAEVNLISRDKRKELKDKLLSDKVKL